MDGKLIFIAVCIGILALAWAGAGVLWRAAEVSEIVAPIETRSWETLTVTTLGTGNEYENPERRGPSTAIALGDTVVLVDAGRGVAEGLRSSRIPLDQPAAIVLTNLLPLNTMGLDDLLFTGWLVPREEPLRVLGPAGTRAFVEALPGGPLPTLAWRFSDGSRRIVVSGSGWGTETLERFATGADVLIHEAAHLPTVEELEGTGAEVPHPERIEREARFHTSILDVGDLARDARVDRLVLVRLRPPPFFDLQVRSLVANDYSGTIVVPEDGDVVFP